MTILIGPRGGGPLPLAPGVDASVPATSSGDGPLCDFSRLEAVDLSGADLDLFPSGGFSKPRSETRVVAAMSGGVDSSVVAALLKYAGYDVVGVTLQLYDFGAAMKKTGACCAGQDIHDARRVAEALNIPHYVLDYESRFRAQVMEDFADTYLKGSTPIPCIRCNQTVKFSDLLATARDLGADAMATGHYIRRTVDANGAAHLARAADPDRDQSYFLFATTREQLDFLRFPLGGMRKPDVRKAASALGLQVAAKPDSQDICFVPAGKYSDVVEKLRPGAAEPGDIVHLDGRIMGRHEGVIRYTIGQRRGLGVATGEPLFVVKLDAPNKRVIVGPREALALIRASHPPAPGSDLVVHDLQIKVEGREGELYRVRFPDDIESILERFGAVPLPPYIRHAPLADDAERYQTVYAKVPGAVAAPTAGLHFDEKTIESIHQRGATVASITLHVGFGTFQPVRSEEVEAHHMHSERYSIPQETLKAISGKRVLAVGTTSLRALESHALKKTGETDLFIYPGFEFRVVRRLLTNFHLPKSTLLMLVSAFAGLENIRKAYAHAIAERYRFFSYGDAMLIER
jgi:tRNA-specific 2-thiouridylase